MGFQIHFINLIMHSTLMNLRTTLGRFERANWMRKTSDARKMADAVLEILADESFLQWMLIAMDNALAKQDEQCCDTMIQTMTRLDKFFRKCPTMKGFRD